MNGCFLRSPAELLRGMPTGIDLSSTADCDRLRRRCRCCSLSRSRSTSFFSSRLAGKPGFAEACRHPPYLSILHLLKLLEQRTAPSQLTSSDWTSSFLESCAELARYDTVCTATFGSHSIYGMTLKKLAAAKCSFGDLSNVVR